LTLQNEEPCYAHDNRIAERLIRESTGIMACGKVKVNEHVADHRRAEATFCHHLADGSTAVTILINSAKG
jgi:hypothetical protein